MGMILDSTSILLIMVPIAAPIAQSDGLRPDPFRHHHRDRGRDRPAHATLRHIGLHGAHAFSKKWLTSWIMARLEFEKGVSS
jgi:hypothetical protein